MHAVRMGHIPENQQKQNMCTASIQRWANVEAAQRLPRWSNTAQTLHKIPCLPGKHLK